MPVVTIVALPPDDDTRIDALLALVVSELAGAIGTPPSNVWAHFVPIAALREGTSVPTRSEYHPIVTVLANPRPDDLVRRGLHAVGRAVEVGLGVDRENVWVHWVDLPHSRVLAQGEVV